MNVGTLAIANNAKLAHWTSLDSPTGGSAVTFGIEERGMGRSPFSLYEL